MTSILLAGFYFLFVTPVGLLMRALGRDPMKRGFDRNAKSYWQDVKKGSASESHFRQY